MRMSLAHVIGYDLVVDHELGVGQELGERDREVRDLRFDLRDVLFGGGEVLGVAVLAREVARLGEQLERGRDLARLFVAQRDVEERADGALVVAERLVELRARLRRSCLLLERCASLNS